MPAEAPLKIRLRDFIMPQKVLEQTGAFDNALLVYSLRRGARWWRRLVRHALEAVLLVYGFLLLFMLGPSDPIGQFIVHLPFTFLLLRYHLLLSDQSHHIKVLRADQLQQLLLTPLGREDYFLHHYLFFCHRYQVMYGMLAVTLAGMILSPSGVMGTFPALVRLFSIVAFTWVAGVAQYVLGWRMFAGGRGGILASLCATAGSIGLTLVCCAVPCLLVQLMYLGFGTHFFTGLIAAPVGFFLVCVSVHQLGMSTYDDALNLLWRRLARDDPDWQSRALLTARQPGFWACIFPFGQRRRLQPQERESLEQLRGQGAAPFWLAVFHGVLFALAFAAGAYSVLHESFSRSDFEAIFTNLFKEGAFSFFCAPAAGLACYVACRLAAAKRADIALSRRAWLAQFRHCVWAATLSGPLLVFISVICLAIWFYHQTVASGGFPPGGLVQFLLILAAVALIWGSLSWICGLAIFYLAKGVLGALGSVRSNAIRYVLSWVVLPLLGAGLGMLVAYLLRAAAEWFFRTIL